MPNVIFSLDDDGNPIIPLEPPTPPPLATFQTIRIVESADELSLHPRALWAQFQKQMLWDHRTYYGCIELLAGSSLIFSIGGINESHQARHRVILIQKGVQCILILTCIIHIHWYSNQRLSTHILTQARSHLAILSILTVITFVFQLVTLFPQDCNEGDYFCSPPALPLIQTLLWLSIPISLFATFVVWRAAKKPPQRDPILAELPSFDDDDVDDEATLAWASTNVAEGIEDDSLDPQGQVRL